MSLAHQQPTGRIDDGTFAAAKARLDALPVPKDAIQPESGQVFDFKEFEKALEFQPGGPNFPLFVKGVESDGFWAGSSYVRYPKARVAK